MAITVVQRKSAADYATSGSITLDSAPTQNNHVFVLIYANNTGAYPATIVFNSGGGNFNGLGGTAAAAPGYAEMFQKKVPAAASAQINWSISGGVSRGIVVHAVEVSGAADYPSQLAAYDFRNATSGTPVSANMSPTQDDLYFIAMTAWLDDTTSASGEYISQGGTSLDATERDERNTNDPAAAGSKGRAVVYDYTFTYGSGTNTTAGLTLTASEQYLQVAYFIKAAASTTYSITTAQLSATIRALAAADKPLLCGLNELRYANAAKWVTSGNIAHADQAASGYATKYSYDDHTDAVTKPTSAQTTWYLVWDLISGSTVANDIDSIFIMNHNLYSIGATLTIEASGNAGFTTITTVNAAAAVASNDRLAFLNLGANQNRYSNVRFLRLKIVCSSAATPQIGEVFAGIRRQLKHKPLDDWDPKNLRSDVAVFESATGKTTGYVRHQGRRYIDATFNPHESAYITDFEAFFSDCEHGSYPFVIIDDPGSYPAVYYFMRMDPPELSGPLAGMTERRFRLAAKEQGPHFYSLE